MDSKSGAAIKVVAGLIYRDGRLLACQRRDDGPFPLKWEFPGGKVETGESDIDALRRELREELAVEARGAVFVCQYDHSYPDGPTVSLRFYHVSEFTGAVKNLIFNQITWCKFADLAQLDFLEGDRAIIQKLLLDGEATFIRR
jgi:mutator protein MutT